MARHRRIHISLALLALLVASCSAFPTARPGRVDITQVFVNGDEVSLGVASCNGAPVAEVGELIDGQYRVEVRTTQAWERGNECLDAASFVVENPPPMFEIVDASSGEVFPVPPIAEPLPPQVDIDGTWRMIEVNGEPVEVGVNTIEIPEITIEAGFLSGQFGCNGGGAELQEAGERIKAFFVESEEELCTIPDGSDEEIATERILFEMLTEGAGVLVNDGVMTWQQDVSQLVFKRVN